MQKDEMIKQIPWGTVKIRCPEAKQLALGAEAERTLRGKVEMTSTPEATEVVKEKGNDE